MRESSEQNNGQTQPRGQAAARREERLAQALRANLKRRKDQARGRVTTEPPSGPEGRQEP